MKTIISIALVTLVLTSVSAQVGINTTTPNGILDVASSSQGILIPRLALTSTKLETPLINPTGESLENSTLVYNTATTNDVIPGFYYWENDRWFRMDSEPTVFRFTTITLPIPSGVNEDTDFDLDGSNYTSSVFRILQNGADLGGISGGTHGRVIHVYNRDSAQDLKILASQNSTSSDSNKFSIQSDVILKAGSSIMIYYDGLYLNRWVVVRSDN